MNDDKKVVRRKVTTEISAERVVDQIQKSYNEAEENLIKFVEEQISLMNNNLLFKGMEEPTFYALNQSLMNYESVLLSLIALHQKVRFDKDITQEKYDNFYAEKYCEVKIEQVNLGKSAQFTSSKEIEMQVRKQWMTELAQLKANCITAENKYNAINYLIDGWRNYAFILNTLSKNAQAEAAAHGIASKHEKEFGDEGEDR